MPMSAEVGEVVVQGLAAQSRGLPPFTGELPLRDLLLAPQRLRAPGDVRGAGFAEPAGLIDQSRPERETLSDPRSATATALRSSPSRCWVILTGMAIT